MSTKQVQQHRSLIISSKFSLIKNILMSVFTMNEAKHQVTKGPFISVGEQFPAAGARASVSFPSSFFSLRLEADEKLSSFTFFPISTRVPNYVDSSKRRLVTRGERKSGEGDKHTCRRSECSEISGAFWQRVVHFKKHQAARTSARQRYFTAAWIKAASCIYNQERAPLYSFL